MRTVWKYPLDWTADPQTIPIPYMSSVLLGPHIEIQRNTLCLWCEVDTEAEPVEYTFHVRGTGHEVPPDVDYLGSAVTDDGHYVWHVFVSQ